MIGQLPKKHKAALSEVLARLCKGQTLTHLDAWIFAYTSRLAAHIHRLRELGWNITTIVESVTCGDGRIAQIARYKLAEPLSVLNDAKVQEFVLSVAKARNSELSACF